MVKANWSLAKSSAVIRAPFYTSGKPPLAPQGSRAGAVSRIALETQRGRIDAVAQPRRLRPIAEDMPQMRLAAAAAHFRSYHAEAVVGQQMQCRLARGRPKAGPAASRSEFLMRAKQVGTAADAGVNARLVVVIINTAERRFRPALAGHAVLLFRQRGLPILIGLRDLAHSGPLQLNAGSNYGELWRGWAAQNSPWEWTPGTVRRALPRRSTGVVGPPADRSSFRHASDGRTPRGRGKSGRNDPQRRNN